jgi:ribosome biogenesis protein BMS1
MGVLTHLDHFKENKQVRKKKKDLKKRFWKEVNEGCKLFYLSGIFNQRYNKTEIHNLARFISVIKVKRLNWRKAHSYVVAD